MDNDMQSPACSPELLRELGAREDISHVPPGAPYFTGFKAFLPGCDVWDELPDKEFEEIGYAAQFVVWLDNYQKAL